MQELSRSKKILLELSERRMFFDVVLYSALEGLDRYEYTIEKLIESVGSAFQSDITKATGLSKAKVSCVLSSLHKKGKVDKIKWGKENLIRLVVTSDQHDNGGMMKKRHPNGEQKNTCV